MTRAAVFLVVLFACSEQDSPPIAGFDTADGGCFMTGCFDNDPCTDDLCLESGECLFVPMDAGNACLDDRHCDTGTGNACEIGRCMVNACNLKRCTFELVPDCRPCGSIFGTCDGGDPCDTSTCDEVSMTCGPATRFAECDSRCSQRTANNSYNALLSWPGFEGPFIGTITPAVLTCERDCECDVAMLLADGAGTTGPHLVTDDTHAPLTCRISTCDGPQTVDCGDFVHGRRYIVYGRTLNLGAAKDRAPAPPGRADTAEPTQQSDSLSVMVACPSMSITSASFGTWLATLEYQGQVAVLNFDSGPDTSSHAFALDCQGCEAMPLEGLERAALVLIAEWPRVRIALSWDSGYVKGDLYPNAMKLVSELRTTDDELFGHLTLEPVP